MWLFSNFDVQTFDQHPGPVSPHPTSAVSHLRVFRMLQWIHIKFVKLVPTLEIKGDIWDVCELGLCALVWFRWNPALEKRWGLEAGDCSVSCCVPGTATGCSNFGTFIAMPFPNWVKRPREKNRPCFLLLSYKDYLKRFEFDSITEWRMYACGGEKCFVLNFSTSYFCAKFTEKVYFLWLVTYF